MDSYKLRFIDGKEYDIEKDILKNLPYFKAIFETEWLEIKENIIKIKHSSIGFDYVLSYLTLGEAPVPLALKKCFFKQCDYFGLTIDDINYGETDDTLEVILYKHDFTKEDDEIMLKLCDMDVPEIRTQDELKTFCKGSSSNFFIVLIYYIFVILKTFKNNTFI